MRLRIPFIVCVCLGQLLWLIVPLQRALAAGPSLELSELLINPASPQTDASDESIRLRNRGAEPLNLRSYSLTLLVGTAPKAYALPDQVVPAGGSVVVTAADATATWALGNSGGTITLLDAAKTVLDTTTWPNAEAKAGALWAKGETGTWGWAGPASPAATSVGSVQSESAVPAAEIRPTELLPDPAAPATDAADEFIELYNPNAFEVNLAGYVVKTGASLATKHTLPAVTMAPASYLVLKSGSTRIALGNTGSSVALFTPAGLQLGATVAYPAAKTGQAWAWDGQIWAWTTTPTPGAANAMMASAPASATHSSAAAATVKAKAAAVPKPKVVAVKTPKATKTPAPKPAPPLVASQTTTGGHWLLFALAGLTIAYIIYEFRYDLRNLYFRFRSHASRGPALGAVAAGGSSPRAGE